MKTGRLPISKPKLVLSILITIILAPVLLYFAGGVKPIIRHISTINGGCLVLAFSAYLFAYIIRVFRFRTLLSKERTPVATMFFIVCAHNFINKVLPAKTGELSYVFLTRRTLNINMSQGVGALLAARLLDLGALCALFGGFGWIPYLLWRPGRWYLAAEFVSLLFGLTVLAVMFFGEKVGKSIREKLRPVAAGKGIVSWIARAVIGLLDPDGLERIRRSFPRLLFFSVSIWLGTGLTLIALVTGFGLPFTQSQILFGSFCALLSSGLPINGIGGIGVLETGWAFGFIVMGADEQLAVSAGFAVNVITVGFSAFLGMIGGIGLALKRRGR